MSFILDALRKSEHARQKQTGPGLAEVRVVAARPKSNVWATAAIALLVVNLVAVGVLLLRRANQEQAVSPANASSTAPAPVSATVPANTTGPTLTPVNEAPVTQSETPTPRVADGGRNPLAEEVGDTAPGLEPSLAVGAASVPAGPPAVTRQAVAPARRGSVVYAPIPEASDVPYSPPPAASAPAPSSSDGLPTADEVTARGGVPALHLDLHVYATSPQQRFIFVNSRKYREGETLQEGPVVERITSTGAVLSYRGSRFQLPND